MTTCYADESGTDSDLSIAVVGAFLLDGRGHFWLDVAWERTLAKYGIEPPVHMREFTPHGKFNDVSTATRHALFADLTKAINDHKLVSAASTLTAEKYREQFRGLTKFSMYGACFANLIALMTSALKVHGEHRWPLSFVLDDGNAYRQHIREGIPYFLKVCPGISGIEFASDDKSSGLQAADVLTWAVRRQLSGSIFGPGFEPLTDLLQQFHLNFDYKEEWMMGVADTIREAESKLPKS